ncbi:hypothetical protein L2Y96_15980 [Luteibacter aegosomaticola]|uniref:hypothetical protein n=1 Tax=Luteibacter aegosomaticola TaxID=2911538 RepID=UPI001FFB8DBC|nr:hypothetical protein [Luteibacter aegosomaticola]UPG88890.1 hypothetical protein L2Y96_15980 [Luteibacter aegosomaticola]
MLAQYVHTAHEALYRIVSHGRRWRALCADQELGRFDTADEAVRSLRETQPAARLPRRLADWRFLPAGALAHLPPPTPSALARLASAA